MKDNALAQLKIRLSSKKLKGAYLFTGEEKFSRNAAVDEFKNYFEGQGFGEFNVQIFEGKSFSAEQYRDAVESFPVMAENKLVIVKDSDIFKTAGEDMKKMWQDVLNELPEYITLVFDEDNIDGRSSLAKIIKKTSLYVEFKFKNPAELATWSEKQFAKSNFKVSPDVLSHLVFSCDEGMENLNNEINKLISYCDDKKTVSHEDVDFIVRKSLQSRIFEMLDAIIEKRAAAAYQMLFELKFYKESPVKIVALIGRQATMLLKTTLLLEANRYNEIATQLGIKPFIVKKYAEQAREVKQEDISKMIKACVNTDYDIKSGNMEEWTAIELLIGNLLV